MVVQSAPWCLIKEWMVSGQVSFQTLHVPWFGQIPTISSCYFLTPSGWQQATDWFPFPRSRQEIWLKRPSFLGRQWDGEPPGMNSWACRWEACSCCSVWGRDDGGAGPHEVGAAHAHTARRGRPQAQVLTHRQAACTAAGSQVWPEAWNQACRVQILLLTCQQSTR